ncbi:MAG: acetyltransferase, ribosomal protein N-acetylase [Ferruginibacter sp.]|nr:acetyltransferase, ribosomal protein N-acetylase [Ferruginibacter sp.]
MLQPDFSPILQIETTRLLLRPVNKRDAHEVFQLRSNEQVMMYIDKERAASITDAEAFINRIIQSLNAGDGITWAICTSEDPSTLIGTIGYWRLIKEHYRAEIGYMLHPGFWNRGIMKEALVKVIETGFNSLNLHSIEAHINPQNTASACLLTGTGFTRDAYFRENFFFNGIFKDTAVYSRLA